jgi:myosin heavy subunit
MVQRLNEQIAELQEDVESKKDVINDRDDEIKALEAERDKLRDHNTMLNTRMAQFRMNEEDFMNEFKVNWETAAKRTVEAKNTKEMQKMKERIAREADRLQNKANKALEEARAIREQSKADIRKAKDDRDARVKALMPEHSRTVRKKDTDLEMKQAEIVKYERAFKIHEAQRVRLEQDKRDLERDLFNKKEAYRRDKISLEETRRELAETSGVLRRESRRIGIMDEEHAAEIQKYVTEIRVIRGALDEETQRAERAEHKIEELNRKLNRFEVAFARSEASNTARESYDTSPHGGEQPSSSPRSLLTVGRSAHDLPGEIVMQDDTIFDGLSTKVLGMQREFSDENAQKHSPVGDQHSQRVDSPKAD